MYLTEKEDYMKGAARHSFIYKTAKALLMPILKRKFNYSFEYVVPVSSPYIVLCNHVTNSDPLLAGLAFKDSMYFVASDHLFRLGLISKLLVFAVSPIARAKTTTDTQTVLQIFRRLKEGYNICIFAEGFSTFSGVTGPIPASIGRLVRRTGVSLITYRLRGGYLTYPRWSPTVRKGRMTGEEVCQYTAAELKNKTDEEVERLIERDLHVDAYADQEASLVAYSGKTLAEHLENALYCCPHCHSFSTMTSKDDLFACTCGYSVRYTPYGYFEVPSASLIPLVYKTVLEWFDWQKGMLHRMIMENSSVPAKGPLFTDQDQQLFQTVRATNNILLGSGTLSLFADRLVFALEPGSPRVFLLSDITDLSIITRMTIIFSTTDRQSYEIHSEWPRNAVKYLEAFILLKNEGTSVMECAL